MIVPDLQSLAEPIDLLEPLPNNPRRGNIEAVARSLEQFGQRKPLIVRKKDKVVLSGNHTLAAATSLGWKEIAVVWVDDDEPTGKAWALADNHTSDLGTYDDENLAAMIAAVAAADEALLAATSYDEADLEALREAIANSADNENYLPTDDADEDDGSLYSRKLGTPVYSIVGKEPAISDLFDTTKHDELVESIRQVEMPDEMRAFLIAAASRHTVFDYRSIAEFYAHQSADIQQLMEESALVIIDFDDAIARGFVKLSERLDRLVNEAMEELDAS